MLTSCFTDSLTGHLFDRSGSRSRCDSLSSQQVADAADWLHESMHDTSAEATFHLLMCHSPTFQGSKLVFIQVFLC